MIALTYRMVQEWTGGDAVHCPLDQAIQGLTIDSRDVAAGVLFVALPGTHTDGHVFVPDIWEKGGVALVSRDFSNLGGPQIRVASPLQAMGMLLRRYIEERRVTVVAVTGSVGKTSVKELSYAVLRTQYPTAASLGNYNTAIGLPLSFFGGPENASHFVAEMGMSAPGEIRQLTAIAPPDVAVISTIGPSHLEKLGSMQAIQSAKGEILEGLKADGVAVLNYENDWVRQLGKRCRQTVKWFGTTNGVHARVLSTQVQTDHTIMRIALEGEVVTVRLPWLGEHQAINVAAALLVGRHLGVSLNDAVQGLQNVSAERSRIRVVTLGDLTLLEDVYNASPLSAKAALDVLKSRPGRRVAVLGDMLELGLQEESGHREVGRYSKERADRVLAVGERARNIFAGAQSVGVDAAWVASPKDAAAWLKTGLQPHDVVLLKASRGMQFEQLAAGLKEWRRQQ